MKNGNKQEIIKSAVDSKVYELSKQVNNDSDFESDISMDSNSDDKSTEKDYTYVEEE